MPPSDGNCSATASAPIPNLNDARLFCNRELSLLAFQKRVLEEARDESNPLLDRLTFLSIFGSNLDEFFMVRVAVLKQRVASGLQDAGVDGLTGTELLEAIRAEVLQLAAQGYTCLRDGLRPALEEANLRLLDYTDLDNAGRAAVNAYFQQTVFPVLTPLAFDPGRPFPHISNLSLNLAVVVRDAKASSILPELKYPTRFRSLCPWVLRAVSFGSNS
jgi:polyphosphate kinase